MANGGARGRKGASKQASQRGLGTMAWRYRHVTAARSRCYHNGTITLSPWRDTQSRGDGLCELRTTQETLRRLEDRLVGYGGEGTQRG